MITIEAKKRYEIICFWKKHGLQATEDAYKARRSTLFSWQKIYKSSGNKIEALMPKKTTPIHKRKRTAEPEIIEEITRLRTEVTPNIGKEKVKIFLDEFCEKRHLTKKSTSTIGRLIRDNNIYLHHKKIYHNGKIKKIVYNKKLRQKSKAKRPGEVVEIDSIHNQTYGFTRYIISGVDTYTRYGYSLSYNKLNSRNAKDLLDKLLEVFPYEITGVKTDNGLEFHGEFDKYLKEKGIKHYWIYPRTPKSNGHIEKYNRTIQEEFINYRLFEMYDVDKFNPKLNNWNIWYNLKRPHWSLNLLSPVQFLINNNFLSNMSWTYTKFVFNHFLCLI
jgi:transposase InsO family protein